MSIRPLIILLLILYLFDQTSTLYTSREVKKNKKFYEKLYGKNTVSATGITISNSCNKLTLVNTTAL